MSASTDQPTAPAFPVRLDRDTLDDLSPAQREILATRHARYGLPSHAQDTALPISLGLRPDGWGPGDSLPTPEDRPASSTPSTGPSTVGSPKCARWARFLAWYRVNPQQPQRHSLLRRCLTPLDFFESVTDAPTPQEEVKRWQRNRARRGLLVDALLVRLALVLAGWLWGAHLKVDDLVLALPGFFLVALMFVQAAVYLILWVAFRLPEPRS